jgi:hypothetical protein
MLLNVFNSVKIGYKGIPLNFHLLQRESHLSSEESVLSNQSQQVQEIYWLIPFFSVKLLANHSPPTAIAPFFLYKTFLTFFLAPLISHTIMKIPGIHTERLSSIFSRKTNLYQTAEAFTIKAIANETIDSNRVAIVTGKKKIGKSAVIRNRADRRIKAALQTVYPGLRLKG